MNIYIVTASTGVWDDYSRVVKAFDKASSAYLFIEQIEREIEAQKKIYKDSYDDEYTNALKQVLHKYDPKVAILDSYIIYSVVQTTLETA